MSADIRRTASIMSAVADGPNAVRRSTAERSLSCHGYRGDGRRSPASNARPASPYSVLRLPRLNDLSVAQPLVATKQSALTRAASSSLCRPTKCPRVMPPMEWPTRIASSRSSSRRSMARSDAVASSDTPSLPARDSPCPRMSHATTRYRSRNNEISADHTHHWSVTPCNSTTGRPAPASTTWSSPPSAVGRW